MFEGIGSDVLILAFYIVLTIFLILLGKLAGKTLYGWYWDLDPDAYVSSVSKNTCGSFYRIGKDGKADPDCKDKTQAQINEEARKIAQDNGRSTGAAMGFMIGGILSLIKAYNIYAKYRANNQA